MGSAVLYRCHRRRQRRRFRTRTAPRFPHLGFAVRAKRHREGDHHLTSYRLYRNLTSRFSGYTPGDLLWFDATHFTLDHGPGVADTALAAVVFAVHNDDDRPDGAYAPSLSVGDVVALDWDSPAIRFLAVDWLGVTEIEGPGHAQILNAGAPVSYADAARAAWDRSRR
jgi:hypothetical protein